MNDENVKDYQQQEQIIKTIKKRFMTYGYKRIKTSAFEQYDVYSHVKSSIHQRDMVKIIDRTGDVLVLRPDATRAEEHTSELQSRGQLVCRLLLEQKKQERTRNG